MSTLTKDKDYKIIRVSSAVIIRKNQTGEDEILLIQRSNTDRWPNFWENPKGKCKSSEGIKSCLKREVKEETGLDVEIVKYAGKFVYKSDDKKTKAIVYNYLCIPNYGQEVQLSFEHSNFKWVSSMAEVQLMCQPEIYKMISQVFNTDSAIVDYDEPECIEEKLNIFLKQLKLRN